MTVGQKLIALRGDKTQSEVARKVGVAPSTISMYEQDERIPRDEVKKRLASYYHTSVERIFYATENHDS